MNQHLKELIALRDRLKLELRDWGLLCERITEWRDNGRKLQLEAEEFAIGVSEAIAAATEHIEALQEDDEADWWKAGGE